MQSLAMKRTEMAPDDYFDAARSPDIHTETIDVTPQMARAWLKRNVVNRKISPSYVDKLVWDILQGKFDYNHESAGFNVRDELIDGQHRFTAIAKAGVPVRMRVSFNVPAEYSSTMNVGRSRSAADILRRAKRDTAVANALILLEAGGGQGSAAKIEETYETHQAGIEWAHKALPMQRGITASLVAGFVYAFPAARSEVSAFAEAFVEFRGSNTADPVVVLRRYVESPRRATAPRSEAALAALRCLQAHHDGESIGRLIVTEQGFEYFAALRARKAV